MVSRKKDTYWHEIAALCLQAGQPPSKVAKVIQHCFPKTDINGRHIGAYKRRLIDAGVIDKHAPTVGSIGELIQLADQLVSAEDRFVYDCWVGSIRRSLKCFEFKLTEAEVNELDEIDIWIEKLN
tara:strand:+ start:236 stop:610 length:375 start_codon:yes stop_codon:yes gene_type:complete